MWAIATAKTLVRHAHTNREPSKLLRAARWRKCYSVGLTWPLNLYIYFFFDTITILLNWVVRSLMAFFAPCCPQSLPGLAFARSCHIANDFSQELPSFAGFIRIKMRQLPDISVFLEWVRVHYLSKRWLSPGKMAKCLLHYVKDTNLVCGSHIDHNNLEKNVFERRKEKTSLDS